MSDDETDYFDEASETTSPNGTTNPTGPARKQSMASELPENLPAIDRAALKKMAETAHVTLDDDIIAITNIVSLFLNSNFHDAEMSARVKYGKSLYHTHGFAILSLLKAVMTFDAIDVEIALKSLKASVTIASHFRKGQSLISSMTGLLGGVDRDAARIGTMTRLEKHAELIYAEAYLLRALLAIITDSTMVAFIREALHIKSAWTVTQAMYRHIETLVEQNNGKDTNQVFAQAGLDEHWITGVLGVVGIFELIFSLMPARVLRIFEMIGFSGNRSFALSRLEIGGGWDVNTRADGNIRSSKSSRQQILFQVPNLSKATDGGLRRFICDIVLLSYHCVIPCLIPIPDIDPAFSKKILDANTAKYQTSFLFCLLSAFYEKINARPDMASDRLLQVQQYCGDWKQLVDITIWELALNEMSLLEWNAAAENFATLFRDNRWSKAVYRYSQAICLYQADPVKNKSMVNSMMKEIGGLTKRVAGKSIPIEKFLARKARKWELQGGRLMLPAFESLWAWNGFDFMPEAKLKQALAQIEAELARLDQLLPPSADPDKVPYITYYDDLCLARLLKGIVLRELALPSAATLVSVEQEAKLRPDSPEKVNLMKDAARQLAFVQILSASIHLDHYLLPFSRYELGRLKMRLGDYEEARHEYTAALNGGVGSGEDGQKTGKFSLESTLHMKTHNAIAKLDILQSL
ncbi:hypothetical protein SeMB42_g04566 [Synchytrium endobioticum]|uniref:Uncharacterized protein n=1 Tax=Synchytrium endobioticum TaxID=286115 RepID=A0A507CXR9_9FUNG|nr:hypothetical protein SeMB42_g04566 [Synchytrium endobioticum]